MAMSRKCRVCGAVVTQRYPVAQLTWLLAIASVFLILIIPTIIGFSSIAGGVAIIIGIFVALVGLYFFVRAPDTCDSCRIGPPDEEKKDEKQ
jgi:hypothetical protein